MSRLSTTSAVLLGALLGFGAAVVASCRVDFPSDARFSCRSDRDCAAPATRCKAGVCCEPQEEVCDGLDNDCDDVVDNLDPTACYSGPEGTLDVGACRAGTSACVAGQLLPCAGERLPGPEACNGQDDDCDGEVDEGIVLASDRENCGACGRQCAFNETCVASVCSTAFEVTCANGTDDDEDLLADCLDPDCEGRACGPGCQCSNLARLEVGCGDGLDNDDGGLIDCLDPSCAQQSCDPDGGPGGCICLTDGGRAETRCYDAIDDDKDTKLDCVDPDCRGLSCRSPPFTSTCSDAGTCACPHGPTTAPETACADGIDNNCNGYTDCADTNCQKSACGAGCRRCDLPDGGSQKAETECADGVDNDGDSFVDCADPDCPTGVSCKTADGGVGACAATGGCQQ